MSTVIIQSFISNNNKRNKTMEFKFNRYYIFTIYLYKQKI